MAYGFGCLFAGDLHLYPNRGSRQRELIVSTRWGQPVHQQCIYMPDVRFIDMLISLRVIAAALAV